MAEKFTEETIKNLKKLNDYEIIIGGKKQRPIVIMPPDGSNQEHFRVYAYGGQIGRVPFDIKKWYHLASDKKYSEYSSDKSALKNILSNRSYEDRKDYLVGKKRDSYLRLILEASRKKFTGKAGLKGERLVQHEIAKHYQNAFGNKDGKNLIITDIELDIPISDKRALEKGIRIHSKDGKRKKGKASKPDFVMFDGTQFGIVELKYLGKSMDTRTANSLDWHYLDFYSSINECGKEKTREIYGTCLRRLKELIDAEIIDHEWDTKWKILDDEYTKNKEMDCSKKFWFGFLFVGGDKKVVHNRMESQLWAPYDKVKNNGIVSDMEKDIAKLVQKMIREDVIDLRCQYCEDNDDIINYGIGLDMSHDLKTEYESLL
ncbi:MAG: hypothetical protein IKR39_00700 [Lachnospiraceae bacterium]|nr:hypothetical protein [Lachnospiraceae bacterium]